MIKRVGDRWTTIQCKNYDGRYDRTCDLCFKVLNGRFALAQQCPYCLGKINLKEYIKAQDEGAFIAKKTEPHAAEKTEDAGTTPKVDSRKELTKAVSEFQDKMDDTLSPDWAKL